MNKEAAGALETYYRDEAIPLLAGEGGAVPALAGEMTGALGLNLDLAGASEEPIDVLRDRLANDTELAEAAAALGIDVGGSLGDGVGEGADPAMDWAAIRIMVKMRDV